ncbi:MAG: transporter, family, nitrate/nitrite transporter, partial [Micromonosporaceae bacterium]
MSTAVESVAALPGRPRSRFANQRWIDDWRPEEAAFWEAGGARVARRNLILSILSEHIGFSVWT